jgi:hypothetical protein
VNKVFNSYPAIAGYRISIKSTVKNLKKGLLREKDRFSLKV